MKHCPFPEFTQEVLEKRRQSWKEDCTCQSVCSEKDCVCGSAKKWGFLCVECDAELVFRKKKFPHPPEPFWGCSKFRSGCEFTRDIYCEPPFIPQPNSAVVTPDRSRETQNYTNTIQPQTLHLPSPSRPQSRQQDNRARAGSKRPREENQARSTSTEPSKIKLQNTFIGKKLAEELISGGGFPAELGSAETAETEGGGKMCYEEEKVGSYPSFRYWRSGKGGNATTGTMVTSKEPVVLDLFAGAGGMSLGFKNAGFIPKYAVESDIQASATLRYNFKEDKMVVHKQSIDDFLNLKDLPKVDHIHASPPCQGFSNAKHSNTQSQRLTANDRTKNDMMLLFPKAVSKMKPATASMETVKGVMSSPEKKEYIQKVVAELLQMGYQVRVDLLNAKDFGDPQKRTRYVLIAAKDCALPKKPTTLYPSMTAEEALQDLEDTEPVPDGHHIQVNGILINDHILPNSPPGHYTEYTLERNSVSPTVLCINKMWHYAKKRCLTVRERARLQSFPDSFCFEGSLDEKTKQIGNAVPVRLAEAVAAAIMETYKI